MRRLGLLLLAVVVFVPLCELPAEAQSVMTHHVRDVIRDGEARMVGRLPADQAMKLDVILPLRDEAALKSFLAGVSDPAIPAYRQYLTVPEFTARFGPTQADYDAVVSFATANGFRVSDPASPAYRQYLTVPEFTARFGPTQADYDAVVSFATANGFRVTGRSEEHTS